MSDVRRDHCKEFYHLAQEALRTSTLELLQSYGRDDVALIDSDPSPSMDEFVLAATIGFAGKSVSGTLAMAVPQPLLDLLSPLRLAAPQLSYGDWIGELGNQLMGRLKNKLLPYGVDISLGTPAVVEGRELRLHSSGSGMIQQRVGFAGGLLCIWLDVLLGESFQLSTSSDLIAGEGSIVIF